MCCHPLHAPSIQKTCCPRQNLHSGNHLYNVSKLHPGIVLPVPQLSHQGMKPLVFARPCFSHHRKRHGGTAQCSCMSQGALARTHIAYMISHYSHPDACDTTRGAPVTTLRHGAAAALVSLLQCLPGAAAAVHAEVHTADSCGSAVRPSSAGHTASGVAALSAHCMLGLLMQVHAMLLLASAPVRGSDGSWCADDIEQQ